MVHVGALPGSPGHALSIDELCERAAREAAILAGAGFDAVLIENMNDTPYVRRRVGPEVVAAMTRIGVAVRTAVPRLPIGVQILAGANHDALAVAQAIGGAFIRAEGFVFASVADEGLLDEADAGPLLRHRRRVGADDIAVWADIKKKHSSHAITADVSIGETASAAEFARADAIIVTGAATGRAASAADIDDARSATRLPVVVGSGATPQSLPDLLRQADGVIVGSWIKVNGDWRNEVDPDRARRFVDARPR